MCLRYTYLLNFSGNYVGAEIETGCGSAGASERVPSGSAGASERVASDGNHLREIIQRTQAMWDLAGNGNIRSDPSLGYILTLYNAGGRESWVEIIMCWSKREAGHKGPRYSSIFNMLPLIFQQMSFFYCAYFSQCVRF